MQPQQERWMFCVDFVFNPFSENQNSAGGAGSGGGAGGSRESGITGLLYFAFFFRKHWKAL